jgi:hypothetical protein
MATTTTAATTPPSPRATRRIRWKLLLLLLVLAVVLVSVLYFWVALRWSYSDGERAGFVQKFSRKGWVCKTWEGELAMATLPGTIPQVFAFSVRDPTVAARIDASMGQRVALHYEQHKGLPTDCFGETEYFVTEVRPVGN